MSLTIHTQSDNPTTFRIILNGRLDTKTAPQLSTVLKNELSRDMSTLVLDMTNLEYISSAGIREVFVANKSMKARHGRLAITGMQPPVKKVFDIIKALPDVSVFASIAELDEYLDAMQKAEDDN
jgi:anti-sigma B factor antagonist